jgi:hypothetical protein
MGKATEFGDQGANRSAIRAPPSTTMIKRPFQHKAYSLCIGVYLEMHRRIVLERMDEFASLSKRVGLLSDALWQLSLDAEGFPQRVKELREEIDFITERLSVLRIPSYLQSSVH